MQHRQTMRSRGKGEVALLAALILLLSLFGLPERGDAREEGAPGTAQKALTEEELLKATQNPVADLISIPIQSITNFRSGPLNRTDSAVSLQPVIPLALTNDLLLISRIIQPVAWQPHQDRESGGEFGLGDMNPTFFLAPKTHGDVIWGAGPAMVLPTATGRLLGQGKFSVGPSAVILAQPGHWTVGALASNVWSVAGKSDRPTVNRLSLQYFISCNLKNDWYLNSAPIMAADWRANGGDRWLVPVGGGFGKLVMFGDNPVDFAASFYGNVVKPGGGPSWQMNLQVTLLFPT